MMILNLTQHTATPEQVAAGVVNAEAQATIGALLTFEFRPTMAEVRERAERLADLAAKADCDAAMIGGAPYLMAPLEAALALRGIRPLYAFSQRESAEEIQPDGSVRKVAVFRHAGFVPAEPTICNFAAVAHGCGYS